MFHLAEHSCGDCMLKCIDCNAQICPKCMVQCPVGNRCKNCSKRFDSHLLKVDFWVIVRTFFAALIAGFLFVCLQALCPLGSIYILFFVYILGTFVGNIIFKIAGRKIGPKVAITVAAGLLAGSFCVSFAWQSIYGLAINNIMTPSYSTAKITDTKYSAHSTLTPSANSSSKQSDTSIPNSADASRALAIAQASRLLAASPISLSLIIFSLGAISPFLGWGNPFSGLFRR